MAVNRDDIAERVKGLLVEHLNVDAERVTRAALILVAALALVGCGPPRHHSMSAAEIRHAMDECRRYGLRPQVFGYVWDGAVAKVECYP